MKNMIFAKSRSMALIALAFGMATATSQIAAAHEGGHHHGHWNSAAAAICKGQAAEADKQACFKQLKEQRKAAMEAFDKSFTYTATTAPAANAPAQ